MTFWRFADTSKDVSEDEFKLLGQVLADTYKIEQILGLGGMGTVYQVSNVRLGKRLAIKVLSRRSLGNDDLVQRFYREARIATDLGHPHIVEVLDFNETGDGDPYMVMEYLAGEDLQAVLRHTPVLPAERAVFIIRQVCSALHAAHRQGVIHRDLKPGNIFICVDEEYADFVKVLDFGISKVLGSASLQTRGDALLGTPQFMAPEQAEGDVQAISAATDVFSVGSILYRLLCGQDPFCGDFVPAVMFQVVHRDPPPLRSVNPQLPEQLERVVARAMEKLPGDRFASVRDLSAALLEAVPGGMGPITDHWELAVDGASAAPPGSSVPVAAAGGPPTTLSSMAAEQIPRSSPRWPLWGALVLLLVAGGVVTLLLLRPGQAPPPAAASRAATTAPKPKHDAVAPSAVGAVPAATTPTEPDASPIADSQPARAAARSTTQAPGQRARRKRTTRRRKPPARTRTRPTGKVKAGTKPRSKEKVLGEGLQSTWD